MAEDEHGPQEDADAPERTFSEASNPTMGWDAYCAHDNVSHHDQALLRRDMQRKGHNPQGNYTLTAWRHMKNDAIGHQP